MTTGIRRVTTESSIWILDFDSMLVTRLPRSEAPNHPLMSYSDLGKPEEFTAAYNLEYNSCYSIVVHRSLDGHRIESGRVLEDTDKTKEVHATDNSLIN